MCTTMPNCQYCHGNYQGRKGVFIALVAALVVLAGVLPSAVIRLTGSQRDATQLWLFPGDSLLFSYSHHFCSALSLHDYSETSAWISLFEERPALEEGTENFIVKRNYSLSSGMSSDVASFYLHPQSSYMFFICAKTNSSYVRNATSLLGGSYSEEPTVTYHILKGEKEYDYWRKYRQNPASAPHASLPIDSKCNWHGKDKYTVTETDKYYFVINASYLRTDSVLVQTKLKIERKRYNMSEKAVESCYTNDKCSVQTHFTQYLTAVVNISGDPTAKNVTEKHLQVTCDPRHWFYIVLTLTISVTLGVVVLTSVLCVAASRAIGQWINHNQYTPIEEQSGRNRELQQFRGQSCALKGLALEGSAPEGLAPEGQPIGTRFFEAAGSGYSDSHMAPQDTDGLTVEAMPRKKTVRYKYRKYGGGKEDCETLIHSM